MEVKKPFILSSMKLPLLDTNSKVTQRAGPLCAESSCGSVAGRASEATTDQAAAPQPGPDLSGRVRLRPQLLLA